MKFKVVDKNLILTDYSHKITEGENSFDTVEIAVPRYHDDCDLSTLSFRFSEISEDGENSAVQVLSHTKNDGKYIYLKGTITSDFSAITGKIIFMLTGVSGENVVAKFQSTPYTISDDISLTSLPNETTAEQLFNQTQLEVQKAIDAAERAEIASQTSAPAKIYPATEEKLGGILSGNDISVDEDGSVTVNSVNGKTLENEFADVKSSQKYASGLAVQIAHPNNFLIYDNIGKPSVMVAIPKFYLDEVIDGAAHTVHPAFIINGVEQEVIYISKYQNIVENGRAYSLPMQKPAINVNFNDAYNYCKNKGEGWHLMTNAEWAAIALWCKKNGTMPKGNNNNGKDISENIRTAIPSMYNDSKVIILTETGSGPASWYHNGSFSGIADLNGNVWEWCSGMRLKDNKIQIIPDNDAANAFGELIWKEILPNGSVASQNTDNTIGYSKVFDREPFSSVSLSKEITTEARIMLEALALIPHIGSGSNDYGNDIIWSSLGERSLKRGFCYDGKTNSGIFAICLYHEADNTSYRPGFRCAYYGNR